MSVKIRCPQFVQFIICTLHSVLCTLYSVLLHRKARPKVILFETG